MGIWLDGRIKVRAFTSNALNRIKKLDLGESFDIPGEFSAHGNQLSYQEFLHGFDAENIVFRIAKELKGEGTVSATYICEEDYQEAVTYYHLGDGEKVVFFSGEIGEDDIYSHQAQHAALLHFSLDELKEIYREAMEDEYSEEEAALYQTYDSLIDVILDIMDICVYEAGEGFFKTPYLKKVMEQICNNSEICRLGCDDYEPNLGWEEKGYTHFSEIEKAYLTSDTMDELNNALKKIKKTTDKRKESSKTSSGAKSKTKKTVEESDGLKQEDIRKTEQSDTNGSWRDQYIQKEIEPDEEEAWTPATDFIYVNNGEEIQINGYTGSGGFIRIPDRIEGNPVTRIAAQAFSGNKTITGLILPKELRFVGNNAFYLCQNLTGTLVIPTNVITLENSAFFWTNFTDIVIRASCKIAGSAFANINNLKAVFIQKGCSPSIGYADFARSPAFVTFIIPEEVKEIQEKNCEACNLVTIYTPADSYASDYAKQNFIRCNTEDYEKIYDEYAERYSSSPKRIQEDSMLGIIQKEFHEELEEELLPDEQQDEIYTPEEFGENVWHSVDGTDYEFRVFGFAGEETPIIIQVRDAETKKLIGTTIETVDFSETAPEGDYEIITDYEVEDIEALSPESFRFNWCATFVQNGMKLYDTSTEITISLDPDADEEESDSSENGQQAADEEIIIPDEYLSEETKKISNDIFHTTEPDRIKCDEFRGNKEWKNIVIPEGVKEIGMSAFADSDIESVECPSSLREIRDSAFRNCRRLHTVKLKEGLETIGFAAFSLCPNLKDIYLPDSIKEIHRAAFIINQTKDQKNKEAQICIHLSGTLAEKLEKAKTFDGAHAIVADSFMIDGQNYRGFKSYFLHRERENEKKTKPEEEPATEKAQYGGNIWHKEAIIQDELRFDDPEELETDDNTQNASFETTVNEKVREEFKRQIREKKSELESLVIKGENIQKEIELLEDMLRRKMDSQ